MGEAALELEVRDAVISQARSIGDLTGGGENNTRGRPGGEGTSVC